MLVTTSCDLDFQTIDLKGELSDLEVDMSSVTIMSDDLEQNLLDFKDAVQIDYAGFKTEV